MPPAWVEPLRQLTPKTAVSTIKRYHKQTVERIMGLQGPQLKHARVGILQPEESGSWKGGLFEAATLDGQIRRALGNTKRSHWASTREAAELAIRARVQVEHSKLGKDDDADHLCTGASEEDAYWERHRARARDVIGRAGQEMVQLLNVSKNGRTYGQQSILRPDQKPPWASGA